MSQRYIFDCPACCLVGGPFVAVAEAEQLAGTHDDLLHQGRPTAVVAVAEPVPAGGAVA